MKTSSDAVRAGAPPLQRYSLNGETMGTRYSALFFAGPGLDEFAIGADLFAAVDQVDRQMSTWKPDSDLSRLNAAAPQEWMPIPDELAYVLESALAVGRQSDGAFDIGVGAFVNAWGFGPDSRQPMAERIGVLKELDYQGAGAALEIDRAGRRARKCAAVTLDLSGIAKGYGVDRLAACLDVWGIASYLVGIDGEMRARGLKPVSQPWSVALEKPVYGVREVMGVMELTDCAIATSGDYRHWIELGDRRYAHTMDPSQKGPLCNRLAAVTVMASSCMLADAWATALLVLGEDKGVELARRRGMDALFVVRDGEAFEQISIAAGQVE